MICPTTLQDCPRFICPDGCKKSSEHEADAPLPDHIRSALEEAHKARMRAFWKVEATIPQQLLKTVTMRGTCYPDSTESEAA